MALTTSTDARVDAYIERAAPFARPILVHVRAAMHAALPGIEETIKWGMPFFVLDGKPFANMAAFKAHCALGFWKGGRPVAEAAVEPAGKAMGQFGRIESLDGLPPAAALRKLIVQAARATRAAHEAAAANPPAPRERRAALPMPEDFAAALRARPVAAKAFEAFAPGQQRAGAERTRTQFPENAQRPPTAEQVQGGHEGMAGRRSTNRCSWARCRHDPPCVSLFETLASIPAFLISKRTRQSLDGGRHAQVGGPVLRTR